MVEEDEGAKSGAGADPAETSGATPSAEPLTIAAQPTSSPKTEWTASDARGPMAAADEEPGTVGDHALEAHPVSSTAFESEPVVATTAPSASPETIVPAPHRSSPWPIAAGLVVGAIVGAVVAIVVYRMEAGDAGADPQVAVLSEKVAALEAKPGPDAALAPIKSSITDLQSKVAALQKAAAADKVASVQTAAANPPKSAAPPQQPAFDPAPLQQKIAALAAGITALQQQAAAAQGTSSKVGDLDTKVTGLDGKLGSLAASVDGLQKQAASNESGLQKIQGQQKSLEGKVGAPALAVVADSLVQQVDSGRPYATQVDALASLGADPVKLAMLKQSAPTGVASAKTLAAQFAPLAEPILAIEHRAPPNAGFMDRMKSGMMSLVSVRRADDVSGNDLSSQVGRIQADLAHDDLADAVATWNALPADAKAKSATWAASAKTSADALTTARNIQSEAIATMGGRKS